MWHYLRDSTFIRFDTITKRDTHRQTDRHMTMTYTALSIASRGKKRRKMQKLGLFGGGFMGHPIIRSSETLPFDRVHMTSYSTFIDTILLSCTVFEL